MSETIAFRVPGDTKESWEQAVEGSVEYDSLTHLIRLSVERELAGSSGQVSGGTIGDERLGEIADTLSRVDVRVAEVADDVEQVRERSHSVGGGIGQDTLTEVFAALPVGGEGDFKRASEIAEDTDLDEPTTEMALEKLREDMPGSVKMNNPAEDFTHWWREA